MAKKKYYSINNIWKTQAQYMLLLGQRANGKSYSTKHKVLSECYKKDLHFVYLRRYRDDIKVNAVNSYFADADIEKITGGQWNGIKAHGGYLYWVEYQDNGEEVRGPVVGRYCALNEAERYKSQVFNGDNSSMHCKYIIYEEFVTTGVYLNNEPERLLQFVSTVARNEQITVILIGNTLSRVSPYFEYWSLEGVLKQKQGTIEIYNFHTRNNNIIKLAVERCEVISGDDNAMFFGKAEKNIVAGEWEVNDFARLERNIKDYEVIYEIKITVMSFNFCMQLLQDNFNGNLTLFIYPLTTQRYIQREITNNYSSDIFISNGFNKRFKAEEIMAELWRQNKVAYSDNLTGTDFNTITQYIMM